MIEKIDDLLSQLVGEFVWSAKRGHGTFLTMEFGSPHLIVREPMNIVSPSAHIATTLNRRNISVVGDASLWIRDSKWTIRTNDTAVDINSSESVVQNALRCLDGQKVISVSRGDDTVLEFDLGATLQLGKSIFPTEADSVLWTLGRFRNLSISILNDGSIIPGSSVAAE